MKTRIFCFIIAIIFLISAVGIVVLTLWNSDPEDQAKYNRIKQNEFRVLADFTLRDKDDRITQFYSEDVSPGKGELEATSVDNVTFESKIALAQTGEIVFINNHLEDQDAPPTTTPIAEMVAPWQLALLGMKQAQVKRVYIPFSQAGEWNLYQYIPSNFDIVIEIKLIKINNVVLLSKDLSLAPPIEALSFKDIKLGDGKPIQLGDKIVISYSGHFAFSRRQFETNLEVERDFVDPQDNSDGDLIKGIVDGMADMRVGGKRVIYIPAELAYGERSVGIIPANTDLIYEVELVDIKEIVLLAEDLSVNTPIDKLTFKDIDIGGGQALKLGDTIRVAYSGYLASNRQQFEANDEAEFAFQEGGLIKGWTEGMVGMKVGGKRVLYIPSELAYGENGSGQAIPPNSDLVFEVELLDIVKTNEG